MKYFRTLLVLATSLLLWYPLPAGAFPQHGGGAGTQGGGMPGGITMQTVAGKVVETMDSGGYTYALVDKDGGKTWVALPKSTIAVGDEIACRAGMVMNNFHSSSLNRTFEHIVFSGGITSSTGTGVAPAETPASEEPTEAPKPKKPEDWKNF